MSDFPGARAVLARAIETHAFPAAVVEVGTTGAVRWREAFGALTYDRGAPAANEESIFDLASLTKVIATASVAMDAISRDQISLEAPVHRWLPAWMNGRRAGVTIRDLLLHCAGFPAWLPLYRTCRDRAQFEAAIAGAPLEYVPRTASIYSDLGFIALGFLLEKATGQSLGLAFEDLTARLDLGQIRFAPPPSWKAPTAPTEFDPGRGRLLVGEVHDENAAALGGVSGNAGLFGTAAAVGAFARMVLGARLGVRGPSPFNPLLVEEFTSRGRIPGSSRALGWDTMLPTSSCGTRMSARAFGHTGFTGTSLWIDPDARIYVVLLTNRVHPTRANEAIRDVRPALHDAVFDDRRA
jgi:CubicO group peptidase (beta-lactamase class C family)